MDPGTITELDRLIDAAWPSEERERLGPWLLRFTPGAPRRANSILTSLGPPGRPAGGDGVHIQRLIELSESFYAQRGLPACFSLGPSSYPSDLDRILEQRGYPRTGVVETWTVDAATVQRAAGAPSAQVTLEKTPTDDWIRCAFDDPLALRHLRRRLWPRPGIACLFASVVSEGRTLAAALGVGSDGWTGVFCMHTHPPHRRRGLGRALLRALGAWSLAHGRPRMFLQVEPGNTPAVALYRACGFRRAYATHDRMQPEGAPVQPDRAPTQPDEASGWRGQ